MSIFGQANRPVGRLSLHCLRHGAWSMGACWIIRARPNDGSPVISPNSSSILKMLSGCLVWQLTIGLLREEAFLANRMAVRFPSQQPALPAGQSAARAQHIPQA
jgi:hypothetical protein